MVFLSQEEKEVAQTFLDESKRISRIQNQTTLREEARSTEFNSLCNEVLQKVLSNMLSGNPCVMGPVHPFFFTVAYGAIKPVDRFHPLLIEPSINMLNAFHDTVQKMVDGYSWEDAKGHLPSVLVTYIAAVKGVVNQVPEFQFPTQKCNLCGNA